MFLGVIFRSDFLADIHHIPADINAILLHLIFLK